MKAQDFLDQLRGKGRYFFTIEEAMEAFQSEKVPALVALYRLRKHKLIASPAKGFYLIVTPEYQAFGCLPANMFVDDLMKYLELPYYVGFLCAGQFYGAAHQKPQRYQVVTSQPHRPISCGRVYIQFIVNQYVTRMPTQSFNTPTGTIKVATPEVAALDLVSSPQHGAGISNVATVLIELAEQIDVKRLQELTKIHPETAWMQRLGYLFESLGLNDLAVVIAEALRDKKTHWIRLVARSPYKVLSRDSKWKIIVNTEVEPDDV